ncbi:MAG: hypothetical protein AAFX79_08105 [Planctomycetota bacterium]
MPELPHDPAAEPATDAAEQFARSLGKLWECIRLYEDGHPSRTDALERCVRDAATLGPPLRFAATETGLASVPDARWRQARSLAERLRSGSIVGLTIDRRPDAAALIAFLETLSRGHDDPRALVEAVHGATGGAIGAHRPTERLAASTQTEPPHAEEDGERILTFGDATPGSAGGARPTNRPELDPPEEVRSVLDGLAELPLGGRPVIAGGATAAEHSADDADRAGDDSPLEPIHWFQGQFDALSDEQRRLLFQGLAADGELPFENAAFALSQMPILNIADAIAVLRRGDAQVSETSLLLLRRLADLAVGSESDLRALASVARDWGDDEPEPGSQEDAARVAAEILERQADGEFRSRDYSELLDRALRSATVARTPIAIRLEDERASIAELATDIICDIAEEPASDEIDASGMYEFLTSRAAMLAESGRFDTIQRITVLATSTLRRSTTQDERDAAHRLLERARRENWLAEALARSSNAEVLAQQLERTRDDGADPVGLLLDVAERAQTTGGRAAVLQAAAGYPRDEILDGCLARAGSDADAAIGLAFLVAELDASELAAALKPALLSTDAGLREHAFRLFERLGGPWPRELCIRGLSDPLEDIRLLSAHAAMPEHEDVLVERLCGEIGGTAPGAEEAAELARLLRRTPSAGTTNRLARSALLRLATSASTTGAEPLLATLSGRPRTGWSTLAIGVARLRLCGPPAENRPVRLQRRAA